VNLQNLIKKGNNQIVARAKRKMLNFGRARRIFDGSLTKSLKHLLIDRYRYHANKEFYRNKVFRKFFKRVFARHRKIPKHRLFNSLLRGQFFQLTGFREKELMAL